MEIDKLDRNLTNPVKIVGNLIFRDRLDELRMVDLWEKTGRIPEKTKITHIKHGLPGTNLR